MWYTEEKEIGSKQVIPELKCKPKLDMVLWNLEEPGWLQKDNGNLETRDLISRAGGWC